MKNYKITLAFHSERSWAEELYQLMCDGLPRSFGVNLLPRESTEDKNVIIITFMMETDDDARKFLRHNYTNMRRCGGAFDLKLNGPGFEEQENFIPCQGFNLDYIVHKPSDEEV